MNKGQEQAVCKEGIQMASEMGEWHLTSFNTHSCQSEQLDVFSHYQMDRNKCGKTLVGI